MLIFCRIKLPLLEWQFILLYSLAFSLAPFDGNKDGPIHQRGSGDFNYRGGLVIGAFHRRRALAF